MAPATVPTTIPARAVAGNTWRWDRSVSGYSPADGWTLTTRFRGAGTLDVTGVPASGNLSWENTASATVTQSLPAGQYSWLETVSNGGGERYEVGRGVVTVEPNPALQNAGNARPWEEAAIASLEAYLAGSLDAGMLEYQIAGRAVKLMSPAEAMAMLDRLQDRLKTRRHKGMRPPIVPEFRRVG